MPEETKTPRRFDADGKTFELRAWSPDDGDRWLARLLYLLRNSVATLGSERAAYVHLFMAMDEATIADWQATCRKYTAFIGEDDRPGHEGQHTEVLLSKARPPIPLTHVQRMAIMREHVVEQFDDFFAQLPGLLGLGSDGSESAQRDEQPDEDS